MVSTLCSCVGRSLPARAAAIGRRTPSTSSSARAPLISSLWPLRAARAATRSFATATEPSTTRSAPNRRSSVPIASLAALLVGGGAAFYLTREEPAHLAPDRWTDVKIKSVTTLTPETSLYRLEVPRTLLPSAFTADPDARPILSLFVKEPSLQIQRAYTPLSAASFNTSGPAELDLVIKRYPDGEVSRYIHRLGVGDNLSVRGPSCTWFYRPQDWDEVVFVVGGTGVTPAYQLIHDTLSGSGPPSTAPPPAVSVVYASPSPSRILLKDSLDTLAAKNPDNVKVHYLVDRPDVAAENADLPSDVKVGFLTRKALEEHIGRGGHPGKRRVVVVCGPEGMLNAVAGPRGRNFSQGPVGGILRELGYTEREVVKL